MDGVDRIVPITPVGSPIHLRVSESNKDGHKRQADHENAGAPAHDVLELHDEEIVADELKTEESPEEPSIGLDIAV